MNETLDRKLRKAKKDHRCDYCNDIIHKGEFYDWSKHICDGELYEWKTHEKCSFIADEIWDYAEPDEGMDSDLFSETLSDLCKVFICPDCAKFDKEQGCCEDDESYCLDKSYEFFKTHELYKDGRDIHYREIWKVRPRKEQE